MKQRKLLRTATAAALAVAFVLLTLAITVALTPGVAAAAADAAATAAAATAAVADADGGAGVAAPAAPPSVAEAPYVLIVIDGKMLEYTDAPLMVNDSRILLPFREALVALGVPNDEEHIIWNDDEQSVTVHNGDDVIRLVIGDPVMTLNGEPVEFDAAPYFYAANNRTYIPIRAISELMDRLVSWDDTASTAYIRDKSSYAETVEALENLLEAVDPSGAADDRFSVVEAEVVSMSVNPLVIDSDSFSFVYDTENMDEVMQSSLIMDIDNANSVMHASREWSLMDEESGFELYVIGGTAYLREPGEDSNGWTELELRANEGEAVLGGASAVLKQGRSVIETLIEEFTIEEFAMRASVVTLDAGDRIKYMLVGRTAAPEIQRSVLGLAAAFLETGYECVESQTRFEIGLDDHYLPIDELFTYTASFMPGSNGVVAVFDGSPSAFTILSENVITYSELESDRQIEVPEEVQALAGGAR